ncbi:MAG: DUF2809 domain-containing protein [Hyphomicrobiaceae bacterium]
MPRHPSRPRLLLALALIIAAGLLWRYAPLDLSPGPKKYGGSALYGAMLYVLVLIARPRLAPPTAAAVAFVLAASVELFKLVQLPWLDAVRLTLPGQLLLGRVFSGWSFLAYAAAIIAAARIDLRSRLKA